jgi:hypothetical protein
MDREGNIKHMPRMIKHRTDVLFIAFSFFSWAAASSAGSLGKCLHCLIDHILKYRFKDLA